MNYTLFDMCIWYLLNYVELFIYMGTLIVVLVLLFV